MNSIFSWCFVILATLASSAYGLRSIFPYNAVLIKKSCNVVGVATVIASAIGFCSNPALAVSGAVAKQEFFKAEDTASVGATIYDEAEVKVIKEKLAGVEKKWTTMMNEVGDLSKKGNNRGDRMEIQSILGRDMADLKVDMRRVSKVASGGDILVRGNVQDAAQFDYNSGKFAYKPIPQQAENVIGQINEVYFNGVKAEAAVLDAEIDKANRLFGEWLALTTATLGK